MVCVFGVLKTKDGIKIRDEMLQWLEPLYDVLKIEQDPPGELVEYPAIKYACQTAIELNESVLYIHTKGAANPNTWIQIPVRHVWKKEFGDKERADKLFEIANNCPDSMVVCPFSGTGRETWFNGFIINPKAAKVLLENLKTPDKCERHYYERMFIHLNVRIFCSINRNCNGIKGILTYLKYYMKENGIPFPSKPVTKSV